METIKLSVTVSKEYISVIKKLELIQANEIITNNDVELAKIIVDKFERDYVENFKNFSDVMMIDTERDSFDNLIQESNKTVNAMEKSLYELRQIVVSTSLVDLPDTSNVAKSLATKYENVISVVKQKSDQRNYCCLQQVNDTKYPMSFHRVFFCKFMKRYINNM